jgi:hypothetical protein
MTQFEDDLKRLRELKVGETTKIDISSGVLCTFTECNTINSNMECDSECEQRCRNPYTFGVNYSKNTVTRIKENEDCVIINHMDLQVYKRNSSEVM